MKKQLLLGLAALAGLWSASIQAAEPFVPEPISIEVKRSNGSGNNANKWCNTWTSTSTAPRFTVAAYNKNNGLTAAMQWHGVDGITGEEAEYMHLYAQAESAQPTTMKIAAGTGYYIWSYTFKAKYYNEASQGETILTVGEQTYTISGESEEQTITVSLQDPATETSFQVTGANNPIKIYDFVVTLAPVELGRNVAGMPYHAKDLNGLNLKLHVNQDNRYLLLNEAKNGFRSVANSGNIANIWYAEYVTKTAPDGTDLSGIRLSSEGVYLGKMPNAKSESVSVTTDANEAGLWRFFAEGTTGYGLSCTEYANGTVVDLQGFGGADEANKNAWIQIGAGAVQRWGVWPAAAHWNVEVISGVPYTLNFGGVTASAVGMTGQTVDVSSLTLPEFFEATDGAITVPAAGETVDVPGQWKFPFEFNSPFFLNLKQNNTGTYHNVYYDGTNPVNKDIAATHLTLNPRLIWYAKDAGVEDNNKVITLHNLSSKDETLGVTVNRESLSSGATITSQPTKFVVVHNGMGFGLRVVDLPNGYVNEHSNAGKFAVWNDAAAKAGDGSRMWAISLTDDDFDVKSWIADDGLSYKFDSEKLDAAKSSKTLEALRDLFTYTPRTTLTRQEVLDVIASESAFASIIGILAHTSFYTAETAAEAVYDELAIPQESDDFAAVLEQAKTQLAAMSAGKILTAHLDGKKVSFRNFSGEGRIVKGTPTNGLGNARYVSALTPDAVWEFTAVNGNSFTLRNLADGKYAKGIDVTTDAAEAVTYQFANESIYPDNGVFAIQNPAQSGNNYLNNNSDGIRYWPAASGNNSSFWYVDEVTETDEAAMAEAIAAIFTQNNLGNEPGLNVPSEDFEEGKKKADSLKETFDYVIADDVYGKSWTVPFDLNSIEGPALIQMAYTPNSVNTYNGNFGGDNQVTDTDIDGILGFGHEASTFVLDGGKLHSLNTGLAVVKNEAMHPHMFDGEELAGNIDNAVVIDFASTAKTNLVTTADGVQRHCYTIKEQGNDWTFGGATHDPEGAPSYHVVEKYTGTAENVAYTVWYVKTLAVNVDESGYKLWRTPVAVNFGDNEANGAYTVSVKGNTITTAPAEASTTYGAGSVFILTQDVILNVENGSNVSAYGTAGLGHHAKQAHQMTAGNVYLTIHADQSVAQQPAPAAVRGLLFDAPELPKVKMAVEIPAEDTTKVLDAHAAVIEAAPSEKSTLKDGGAMMLSLGGSNDTTEIAEIGVDSSSAAGAIYDLQGRRLAAPAKGINIVNGKKVLCK